MAVRLANAKGRATLIVGEQVVDIERASKGRFPADVMAALTQWAAVADWAAGITAGAATGALQISELGPCVPRPAKVFAIGLNYKSHAHEAGLPLPGKPMVFTKFPNCLTGPGGEVVLFSPAHRQALDRCASRAATCAPARKSSVRLRT